MPTANAQIKFKYGLQANYTGLATKELNTFYFATDSQRLFVGDVEYSRPIQHGTELPTTFLPPNSLFVKEVDSARDLYYSKDGSAWDLICSLPAAIAGGVFGDNTAGKVDFGATINVPKVTVSDRGVVTAVEQVAIQLPDAPEIPDVTITGNDAEGNVITGITSSEHGITVTKDTFVPAAGGEYTGNIVVPDATADGQATNLKQVTTLIDNAIGGVNSFEVDSNGGTGYADLAALQAAVPAGEKGVFYLVVNPNADADGNQFVEYFWTGDAYEMAGKFGSVDMSHLATKEELSTAQEALQANIDDVVGEVDSITVNGNTYDVSTRNITVDNINGNAATADKLNHTLTIQDQTFDGSEDVTIEIAQALSGLTDTQIAAPIDGHALVHNGTAWVNRPLTKADVGLGQVDNTADADKTVKHAGTADSFATATTVNFIGDDATGTMSIQGGEAAPVEVTLDVKKADAADTATDATNATNMTKSDGSTQNIEEAIAAAQTAATLVWETY